MSFKSHDWHDWHKLAWESPTLSIRATSNCVHPREMSAADNVQAPADAGVITLEEDVSSVATRCDSLHPPARSNLSGGIGPARTARSRTSVSVNAGLEMVCLALRVDAFIFNDFWKSTQKYGMVVKGFKVLQSACKNLKHKLADCEEKIRSREQSYAALEEKFHDRERAYTTLEEKARSAEASYAETVSKLTDKIHSYDTAYTQLLSQAEEENRSSIANFKEEISRMEERIRFNEASCMALVSQMEGKVQASEAARSELANKAEECERALKDRESVGLAISIMDLIGLNDI